MNSVDKRTWWARFLLMVLGPILLAGLVEGVLSLTGLFPPVRLLLPVKWNGAEYMRANPEFGRLFLPRRDLPMPSPTWVRREKTEGVTRVVLLGESAAAGFPHPEFNLARLVEHVWRARFPDHPIEVVNLTMVGVNSHILRIFAEEARQLNPDVLVLYAGHNEAIGPFGPASVFGRNTSSILLTRLNLWVRNLRLGRALEAGYRAAIRWRGQELPVWMGLEEFREAPMADDDPRLDVMARHVARNMQDLVGDAVVNGMRVVVAIPAVNLTDWPPLGSDDSFLVEEPSLVALNTNGLHSLRSARQVYTLATEKAHGGDWDGAWPLYRRALDLDLFRFRADRRVRTALIRLDGKWPAENVRVVDIDRALHEDNPGFVTDRTYFCEHVHLTFPGRAVVASMIVDELNALLGPFATEGDSSISVAELAAHVFFTPLDEKSIWMDVRNLLSLSVFNDQPERDERRAFLSEVISQLRIEYEQKWNPTKIGEAHRAASVAHPGDPLIDLIAGRLLMEAGAWEASASTLKRGLARWPNYHPAWLDLARVSMSMGLMPEARDALLQAERYSVDQPRLPALRGEYHARVGEWTEARHFLEIAVTNRPNHYQAMVNLANVYTLLGMEREAIAMFNRCIELNESDPGVLNNLAWLLASSRSVGSEQRPLALHYATRANALRPGNARYLSTLSLAQAANGQVDKAKENAAKAVAGMANAGDREGIQLLTDQLARWGVEL